jgi:hypothetical protein
MKRKFDYSGSSFDSFLEEEGIREEVEAVAVKRVIAWELEQARRQQKKTTVEMARALHTSRSQLSRLLDPTNTAVSLETIARAAQFLGKNLEIHLRDTAPIVAAPHKKRFVPRKPALKTSAGRRPH